MNKKQIKKPSKKQIKKPSNKPHEFELADDSDPDNGYENKDYEDFTNLNLLEKLEKKDINKDAFKDTDTDTDTDDYDGTDDEWNVNDDEEDTEKVASEFITTIYKIPDNERTTSNRMTTFEYARLLSIRVSMLQNGASSMVNNENLSYAEDIAIKEIYDRKTPFKFIRRVGIDKEQRILYEEWDPKEMTFPVF